jgi:hypothetical protein
LVSFFLFKKNCISLKQKKVVFNMGIRRIEYLKNIPIRWVDIDS